MSDLVTLIGLAAASLAAISFLPQAVKTWKTKSARDISFKMLIVLLAESFLWIIYGNYINSLPVIASNLITFLLVSILLVFKIKYR